MDSKPLIKSGTAWSALITLLPQAWSLITLFIPKLRIISSDDVSTGVGLVISTVGFFAVLVHRVAGSETPISGLFKTKQ